jgi:hypothetical protein
MRRKRATESGRYQFQSPNNDTSAGDQQHSQDGGVEKNAESVVLIPFSLPAPVLEDAAERLALAAAGAMSATTSRRRPAYVA